MGLASFASSSSHGKTIYEVLGRESVHPFPARMAPGIAFDVLAEAGRSIRVLDPMMGSGTVLALARVLGHRAVGIDIDPLAVLLTRVWTTTISHREVKDAAAAVLAKARNSFQTITTRDAYPIGADEETRAFIRFWFDPYSRRQLTALSRAVEETHETTARDALWCAFSRLIITKQAGASLAMDLSHSRPHKKFSVAPVKPFNKFLAAVDRVVDNCLDSSHRRRGPSTTAHEGDARALPISDGSIDLVLTSPPYLNAIDYMRCSKFSLVWMGNTIAALRQVRSESVGAESTSGFLTSDSHEKVIAKLGLSPALAKREQRILMRYVRDMSAAVGEASRVLVEGGKAVYVVGENTVRGTYIRNSDLVCEVARTSGLNFVDKKVRELPANRRYLPPPTGDAAAASLDGRMRREVVLSFKKQ
ncbi:MAG TPA: hypothetical protein VGQ21_13335 [Thermoanaerobaculia bacterium]|nr:hypothetical protein [Thermoanaerobaculia bacterium]